MGKKSSGRDYNKGYHDARSGKPARDPGLAERMLDDIIPGPSTLPSKAYNRGHKDGKTDSKKK